MTTRSPRPGGTTAAGLVLALVMLGGLLAGCSGDEPATQESPTASATPAPSAAPERAIPTDIQVAGVRGKLDRSRRQRLVRLVGRVVDRWVDNAYLGEPPRRNVSAAFAGFTRGARAEARRDRALLSNAHLRRVEAVTAARRRVRLDVLAPNGRAVGVTARVHLVFRIEGARARRELVSGALYLSPLKNGWTVFGYDLSRGVSR